MELRYNDAFLNYSCDYLDFYITDLEKMIEENAPYYEILRQYTKADERLSAMRDLLSITHHMDNDDEINEYDEMFDKQEKRLLRVRRYFLNISL